MPQNLHSECCGIGSLAWHFKQDGVVYRYKDCQISRLNLREYMIAYQCPAKFSFIKRHFHWLNNNWNILNSHTHTWGYIVAIPQYIATHQYVTSQITGNSTVYSVTGGFPSQRASDRTYRFRSITLSCFSSAYVYWLTDFPQCLAKSYQIHPNNVIISCSPSTTGSWKL